MSAISDYLENAWLDMLANATAFTAPSTYVGLFTSDPTDAGTGTEVSGGSYARVQVNQDATTQPYWNAITDSGATKLTDNNGAITFPTATASWGTVTHVGVFDAASGGNLLYHGALTTSKTVGNGDTFEIADGDLDLTLA